MHDLLTHGPPSALHPTPYPIHGTSLYRDPPRPQTSTPPVPLPPDMFKRIQLGPPCIGTFPPSPICSNLLIMNRAKVGNRVVIILLECLLVFFSKHSYLFAESMRLEDVKIFFLPLNSAHELCKKNKYQKKFDVVYLSNRWVSHLTVQQVSLSSTYPTGESLIYLSNRWVSHLPVQQVSFSSTCPTVVSLIYQSNRWVSHLTDWCKSGS